MAVGAAMTGLRPIVEGMNMGFLLLAFNQISNNMGMLRYTSGGNYTIPTVVRGPGGVGRQLGAEHSQRLEAYFHAVPGIKIVACSTPTNAKGLMKAAIRDNNPVVFFEHVLLYNLSEEIPAGEYICALDQAEIVRSGKDLTILTYSRMRHHCLKAVEQLEAEGVDVELIDLISLKPFDLETISASIRKTHRVIIVEECMKTGGIGAELIALITENCFDELDARPVRLSSQDIPTPYNGKLENLPPPPPSFRRSSPPSSPPLPWPRRPTRPPCASFPLWMAIWCAPTCVTSAGCRCCRMSRRSRWAVRCRS